MFWLGLFIGFWGAVFLVHYRCMTIIVRNKKTKKSK